MELDRTLETRKLTIIQPCWLLTLSIPLQNTTLHYCIIESMFKFSIKTIIYLLGIDLFENQFSKQVLAFS